MVLGFLLNLFFYASGISRKSSLLFTSGIMAVSYFISNHLIDLTEASPRLYLEWSLYDMLTILLIVYVHKFLKTTYSCATKYVFVGLASNILLFVVLYIDVAIIKNTEPWWFWDFFSLAINVVDIVMVSVLIINKDFLGLDKLRTKLSR